MKKIGKSSSAHDKFFNSLKQVEKRLKLENNQQPRNTCNTQNSDSLCTPMYIIDEPSSNSNTFQETETNQETETIPSFPSTQNNPQQEKSCNVSDEIGLLMEQLGLSDSAESINMMGTFGFGCDDGFYERVVGMKGPKNWKEMERMESWIKCFLNGGEVKEPFKLVHLLLAKAAFVHLDDDDDGFGGFEFPCTVSEFLRNDPPVVD